MMFPGFTLALRRPEPLIQTVFRPERLLRRRPDSGHVLERPSTLSPAD